MKKKIAILSVFAFTLFACKKEVFLPNSDRMNQDRTSEVGSCPMKNHPASLGGGCGMYGRSAGDNSTTAGNPTVGDTTTHSSGITDPNNDDDESGPVSGIGSGTGGSSNGNSKIVVIRGGK